MAFMNQEKKAVIAKELKNVVPKGWRYGLSVRNHAEIQMTIRSAPIDLVTELSEDGDVAGGDDYIQVNHYWIVDRLQRNGKTELAEVFQAIIDALNIGNHDNSDSQSDYFDVGHYVNIHIGQYDRPFVVK